MDAGINETRNHTQQITQGDVSVLRFAGGYKWYVLWWCQNIFMFGLSYEDGEHRDQEMKTNHALFLYYVMYMCY